MASDLPILASRLMPSGKLPQITSKNHGRARPKRVKALRTAGKPRTAPDVNLDVILKRGQKNSGSAASSVESRQDDDYCTKKPSRLTTNEDFSLLCGDLTIIVIAGFML